MTINLELKLIDEVVKASCALHNYYLMTNAGQMYILPDYLDFEDIENGTISTSLTGEH